MQYDLAEVQKKAAQIDVKRYQRLDGSLGRLLAELAVATEALCPTGYAASGPAEVMVL